MLSSCYAKGDASTITGTRKPAQIEETAIAADWELDEWTVSQIEALLKQREEELAGLKA